MNQTRLKLHEPSVDPDDRAGARATLVTSPLPVEHWHAWICDYPAMADAMLDRMLPQAHRIVLKGDSLRASERPGGGLPPPLINPRYFLLPGRFRGQNTRRVQSNPRFIPPTTTKAITMPDCLATIPESLVMIGRNTHPATCDSAAAWPQRLCLGTWRTLKYHWTTTTRRLQS